MAIHNCLKFLVNWWPIHVNSYNLIMPHWWLGLGIDPNPYFFPHNNSIQTTLYSKLLFFHEIKLSIS